MTDWLTCVVSRTFCMNRTKAGDTASWSEAVAELGSGIEDKPVRLEVEASRESEENQR